MTRLFKDLNEEYNNQQVDASMITTGYTALADGLWLDILITPRQTSPEKARSVAMNYLASQFPKHFLPDQTPGRAN